MDESNLQRSGRLAVLAERLLEEARLVDAESNELRQSNTLLRQQNLRLIAEADAAKRELGNLKDLHNAPRDELIIQMQYAKAEAERLRLENARMTIELSSARSSLAVLCRDD